MPAADLAAAPDRRARRPAFAQFPTAWRFALRNQTRNRLAGLLLVLFVPAWYLLMAALAGHQTLSFRLFATGQVLTVDARSLTLITAGLNSLTLITGFAVFAAIRRTLAFDQRLVFAGYRQPTLIAAKTLAIAIVAAAVAALHRGRAAGVLAPGPGGLAGHPGRLRRHRPRLRRPRPAARRPGQGRPGRLLPDHHGLADGHLPAEPARQPASPTSPILEWFPSFGPMQFAAGGAFGHTALWGHLLLGLAWAAAFTAAGPGHLPRQDPQPSAPHLKRGTGRPGCLGHRARDAARPVMWNEIGVRVPGNRNRSSQPMVNPARSIAAAVSRPRWSRPTGAATPWHPVRAGRG